MKQTGHRSHVSGMARFVRTWRRKVDEVELRHWTALQNAVARKVKYAKPVKP